MKTLLITFVLIFGFFYTLHAQDFAAENVKNVLSKQSSARWTLFKHFQNGTEITGAMPICVLDNVFTFSVGGNFQASEGRLKCRQDDPDELYAGFWSYQPEGRVLSFQINGKTLINWQITALNHNKITFKVLNLPEGDYTIEMYILAE
jgi:hypothetical protein